MLGNLDGKQYLRATSAGPFVLAPTVGTVPEPVIELLSPVVGVPVEDDDVLEVLSSAHTEAANNAKP